MTPSLLPVTDIQLQKGLYLRLIQYTIGGPFHGTGKNRTLNRQKPTRNITTQENLAGKIVPAADPFVREMEEPRSMMPFGRST